MMQFQLIRRAAEIKLAGQAKSMNSPRTVLPKVNLIQVGFKNRVLGVTRLQNQRHDDFVKLANQGALGIEIKILHQLLGQCATALHQSACTEIGPHRPQDALGRNAKMIVKIPVLHCQQCIHQGFRRLLQFDQNPVFLEGRVETADLNRFHA